MQLLKNYYNFIFKIIICDYLIQLYLLSIFLQFIIICYLKLITSITLINRVAASGHEIATRPFQLVTGRQWKGTAFGGWKARTDVPKLVQKVQRGELKIDDYVTHVFDGIEKVNESIHALHSGDCIRAVIKLTPKSQSSMVQLQLVSSNKYGNGYMKRFKHFSESCQSEMTFSIYLPEDNIGKSRGPNPSVLYYLAGLSCTDETGRTKLGFHKFADKHKIAIVFPDTSPRIKIEGDSDDWDFGQSAGFYLNATEEKWKKNYNMFQYVTEELPLLIKSNFSVDQDNQSIMGHSMGGHGSLICGLKKNGFYKSVSAFAPISNPTKVPWGKKAFEGYLGSVENGRQYDAVCLLQDNEFESQVPILIDQGSHDDFYNVQLQKSALIKELDSKNWNYQYRTQEGYDHGYFFVSTFVEDHFDFHAKYLNFNKK